MPINPNVAASDYTAYLRTRSDTVGRKFVPPDFTTSLTNALTLNSKVGRTLGSEPVLPAPGYLTFDGWVSTEINVNFANFTIEFFANVSDTSIRQVLFETSITGSYFGMILQNGKLRVYHDVTLFECEFPNALLNSWHHYAICRKNASTVVCIDGVQISSPFTLPTGSNTRIVSIGGVFKSTSFTGKLTNFRVMQGALYPGEVSFPLTAKDSYLFIRADGPIVDSSSFGRPLEITGKVKLHSGPIQISPPIFSDYGVLDFNGLSYVSIDSGLTVGDGPFTIDWYMKPTSYNVSVFAFSGGTEQDLLCWIDDSKLVVAVARGPPTEPPLYGFAGVRCVVTLNEWHKYSIRRTYDYIHVLFNDSVIGGFPITGSDGFNGNDVILGGGCPKGNFSGSITNFRIAEGYATGTLPLSGGIFLLLANPFTPFRDSIEDSTKTNYGVTNSLGPIPHGLQKEYNVLTGFSATKSLYYPELNPWDSDFTIECFFKGSEGIIWTLVGPFSGIWLYLDNGELRYGTPYQNEFLGEPAANTWYHISITRHAGNFYAKLAGEDLYFDPTMYLNEASLAIGDFEPGSGETGDVSISNFRYTKRAVYTTYSHVLVPTVPLKPVADTELLLLAKPGKLLHDSAKQQIARGTCDVVPGPIVPPEQFTDYGILTNFLNYQYLSYPGIGMADFTVEFFVSTVDPNDTNAVVYFLNDNGHFIGAYINSGTLYLELSDGDYDSIPIGSITANTWYHVALSRIGTNLYTSVNGVTTKRNWLGATPNITGAEMRIGISTSGNNSLNGSISNFRLTSGLLYDEGTYLIPTLPLPATENTKLLLLAKPGAPLVDSSSAQRVTTGSDVIAVPGPLVVTQFTDYGIFSGFSTSKYLLYPGLNPGTSNFTVECFFKYSGDGYIWSFDRDTYGSNGLTIGGNVLSLTLNEVTGTISSGLQTNTWYYCAITRSGNAWYATLDGVTTLLVDNTAIDLNGNSLSIGGDYFDGELYVPFDGFISNFRYTKLPLYASTTTVRQIPAPPLLDIEGTELLLLAKPGENFTDSSKDNVATGTCTVTVEEIELSQFSGYGILGGFSPTRYLAYPDVNPGTSDFTVECFFERSGSGELWAFRGFSNFFEVFLDNGVLQYDSSELSGTIGTITQNTRYHCAITRQSGSWYVSLNGTSSSKGVFEFDLGGANLTIGENFAGSITNFRFVNRALYTGDYAVPSLPLQYIENTQLLLLAKPDNPLGDSSMNKLIPNGICDVLVGP